MQNTVTVKNERPIFNTKTMVVMALMTAMAYAAVTLFRIPVVVFLKYEPKDVIITIGGFMFGPLASVLMSLVVSLVEMVTISDTGPIGALMNFIGTCSFACLAALIYKSHRNIKGAVAGLAAGTIVMILVMLAWNYLVTPIYMGYPREAVAAMLLPVFLPFNLLKGVLNSAFTMVIYKPLSNAMKKAHILPGQPSEDDSIRRKINAFVYIISIFIIITCAAVIVIWRLQG